MCYVILKKKNLIACHAVVCVMNSEEIGKRFYPEAKATLKIHIITFSFLIPIFQR